MSFSLKPVLTEWLKKYESDVAEVTDYNEDYYMGGGCETCYYEEWEVEIRYLDSKGDRHTYIYSGKFAELIRELENA